MVWLGICVTPRWVLSSTLENRMILTDRAKNVWHVVFHGKIDSVCKLKKLNTRKLNILCAQSIGGPAWNVSSWLS